MTDPDIKRFGEHHNAFGFLRLLFASLVILSHTPELYDGNRDREILTQIFGTLSFGELAVDGFFIISGYLIVGSFVKRPHAWPYLRKRIARIYPAFLLATLMLVLIVAPLGGRPGIDIPTLAWALTQTLLLQAPEIGGAFAGTHYPYLDGAMWTIAFEFRCYLLVLILGLTGIFRHRRLFTAMVLAIVAAAQCIPADALQRIDDLPYAIYWIGRAGDSLRLTGLFMMGALFYLWRDVIPLTRRGAILSGAGLLILLNSYHLAHAAVGTFGAYMIFTVGTRATSGILSKINNRDDISYGVYLYAWPVQKLIFWFWPAIALPLAGLTTFVLACLCGAISWFVVEKPVMQRLR